MYAVSKAFHRFAIAVVAMTVLLVWMGAAVTTEGAGMAFSDWPLSAGSINPEGWLKILPYFLEHGHRLIASTVGMMTLALFAWSFVRGPAQWIELIVVVLGLAVVVYLMTVAGSEREDAGRKVIFWWAAAGSGAVVIAWLVWSWVARGWPLVTKLSALALVAVVGQAILGGMRVTEVSDANAVLHACLAQAFFCLLLLIVAVSGASKPQLAVARSVRGIPVMLCAAVFLQLVLGALMRHFHRDGLADTGIVLTQGELIPPFDSPIIVTLFLHKYWAILVLLLGLSAAFITSRLLPSGHNVRRSMAWVAGLLLAQVALGIAVIVTGKSFWITNFHVLNGLAILGLAFIGAARSLGIIAPPQEVESEPRGSGTESLPTGQA